MLRSARDHLPDALIGHSRSRYIAADVEAVWEAMWSVRLRDLPVTSVLLALRSLPRRVTRSGTARTLDRPLLRSMVETRFAVLVEEPPSLLTLGIVGQFWRLSGGRDEAVENSEEFVAHDRPGYVKSALDFVLVPHNGGTRLTTETWSEATDPRSARRFGRYWRVVGWGSRLIRDDLLRGIARRAERRSAP